jgi:hypothetical protein
LDTWEDSERTEDSTLSIVDGQAKKAMDAEESGWAQATCGDFYPGQKVESLKSSTRSGVSLNFGGERPMLRRTKILSKKGKIVPVAITDPNINEGSIKNNAGTRAHLVKMKDEGRRKGHMQDKNIPGMSSGNVYRTIKHTHNSERYFDLCDHSPTTVEVGTCSKIQDEVGTCSKIQDANTTNATGDNSTQHQRQIHDLTPPVSFVGCHYCTFEDGPLGLGVFWAYRLF